MFFKIIFYFLLSIITLNAMLVGTPSLTNDIKVLQELDIDSSYIADYSLQKDLQKRLKNTKKRYTQKLNDAYLFIPKIKKILKENGIPSSFLYMAMAESNFILNAHSKKKAKGIWQFMPNTARFYGLETDHYIDERMDIVKSTQAAVKYLQKLHDMFGKWYLAAIAYNCGEGRVIEGLTRAKLDMYCEDIGYKQCRKDKKISSYRYIIKMYQQKRVKFKALNKVYKTVKKWKYNPDIDKLLMIQTVIKRQYIPNESRAYLRKIITLAIMNNSDFLLKDENIHLLNRGISDPIAQIDVKSGVKLKDLAKIVGISIDKLESLNLHIRKSIIPTKKDSYKLYIPYSKLARYNANKKLLRAVQYGIYIVKTGDSLGKIASKYNISYKLIKKYNHLKSNIIKVGQELEIPSDKMLYPTQEEYIVKIGDTLSKIAVKHKIKLTKLMADNNLHNSTIRIGDKLVIKY